MSIHLLCVTYRHFCSAFNSNAKVSTKILKFIGYFSLFVAFVVIVLHAAVECEKPTNDSTNNEISRQRTFDFLHGAASIFPHFQPKNDMIYFSTGEIAVCTIPKNGYSVIRFVNCLLTLKELKNETAYKSFASLSTFEGVWPPPSQCKNTEKSRNNSDTFRKITFVRDPIKRFISAWLFACKRLTACFNCGLDFGCFLKTFYFCWITNKEFSKICTYSSPYNKALQRITPNNNSRFIFYHFSPQVNYCNNDAKVIKYSTENINNFLLSTAKPLLREDEYTKLHERLNQKTSHAANEHEAKDLEILIRSNRTLTRMLAQLYFMDYKIFEIDMPHYFFDSKLYENVDIES